MPNVFQQYHMRAMTFDQSSDFSGLLPHDFFFAQDTDLDGPYQSNHQASSNNPSAPFVFTTEAAQEQSLPVEQQALPDYSSSPLRQSSNQVVVSNRQLTFDKAEDHDQSLDWAVEQIPGLFDDMSNPTHSFASTPFDWTDDHFQVPKQNPMSNASSQVQNSYQPSSDIHTSQQTQQTFLPHDYDHFVLPDFAETQTQRHQSDGQIPTYPQYSFQAQDQTQYFLPQYDVPRKRRHLSDGDEALPQNPAIPTETPTPSKSRRQTAPVPIPPLKTQNQPKANGPLSRPIELPPRKKPGRKPLPEEDAGDRRRMQNRQAQRNFRDKRSQRLHDTQQELTIRKADYEEHLAEHARELDELQQECNASKKTIGDLTQRAHAAETALVKERRKSDELRLHLDRYRMQNSDPELMTLPVRYQSPRLGPMDVSQGIQQGEKEVLDLTGAE